MTRVDTFIIEFLYKCDRGDALLTPKVVATNINYERSYVNGRLKNHLSDHDLVVDAGNGLYRLSERGKLVARGELEAEDLIDE